MLTYVVLGLVVWACAFALREAWRARRLMQRLAAQRPAFWTATTAANRLPTRGDATNLRPNEGVGVSRGHVRDHWLVARCSRYFRGRGNQAECPSRVPKAGAIEAELASLVEQVREAGDPRLQRAAFNQLVLEVNRVLQHSDGAPMYWRVCSAAALAGGILTLWEQLWLACSIGALGACSAVLCSRWAADAQCERRRAKATWRRFIDTLRPAEVESDFQPQ